MIHFFLSKELQTNIWIIIPSVTPGLMSPKHVVLVSKVLNTSEIIQKSHLHLPTCFLACTLLENFS